MKKVTLLFLLLLLLCSANSVLGQTNFTATYTFTGSTGNVASFAYNGTTYPGIAVGSIEKVGVTTSPNTDNFRATGWPTGATDGSNTFTGSVNIGKYIGFTITANSGYKFTVSSITFGIGRSGTGTRQLQWRGSADSYGSIINNYTTLASGLTNTSGVLTNPDANSSWTGNVLTLGSSYADITTSAGFRLYFYNAEAAGGTAGLQTSLTITGTYTSSASTPTITVTPTSLTGFTYVYGNGPSTEQSFTASAANLTTNLTLDAPADYEISTTSGSGFGSSVSLTPSGGSVAATTVYVRLKSGLAVGTYNSETITAASSGATSKTVTCSGTVTCTASTVSFASGTINKNTGDATFTNTFSSNSSGAVNYTSSNTSVATVSSDGTVTIIGGGTTTITATQAAAGNYCSNTATYTLNIRSVSVSPTSLSFSSNTGTTSASQSVTVTGTQLSTAPTYAISGTDAAMFAASGTLTTDGGTVVVTFTPTSVGSKTATLTITGESGAVVKTVSLTGSATLEAPTATAATSVSTAGFAANWDVVSGAGCYKLDVYTKSTSGSTTVTEEFSGGTTAPTDWTFTTIGGTYTTSGNYGVSSPSLQFDATGDQVITPTLPYAATSLSFWIKGQGTNASSALLVEGYNGSSWVSIQNITSSIPTTGTTYTYNSTSSPSLPSNIVQFRFTYTKSSGNLAFDDVSYTYSSATNDPVSGSPFTITAPSTSYSLTGLTAGTTYYYTVKATDCSATSSSASNEISVSLLSGPSITVSPSSVSGLDYAYEDGPSPIGTFDVAGYDLSGNITVTAPTDFEVSLDGSVYSSVLTLPAAGGTVYVRLKAGLSIASYAENLTLVSGSASAVINLDGNVIAGQISINDVLNDSSWTMSMPETGTLKIYEQTTGSGYADELFFSKYLEGQGNNKLLEIYNGTQNTITDLSIYSVKVFQNGGGTAINWVTGTVKTYTLSGSLAPGESKVIFTRSTTSPVCSNFDSSWQEFTITNPLQFNGNDPVILVKTVGGVSTTIDVIGQTEGTTPASYWGDASLNTLRVFLVRNNTVKSGVNAVAANTTSFSTLTTEWTMQTDIDEGTSGTSTCDAISDFGSYDYNATYGSWNLMDGVVSNTNQVTISDASARPCELMKAEITDASNNVLGTNTFRIPIMVKDSKLISDATSSFTSDVCSDCDIAILNGGTLLSSSSGNRELRNAYVLAGGKMDITNGSWAIHNLVLKAGYSGNLYSSFPTASLKINNSLTINGILRYIRTFDDTQWYFISFPYDVKISDITSPDPSFGAYNYTNWFIKYWDGQSRATNRTASGNWKKYIPGDAVYNANNGYLKANVGYNFGLKSGIKEVVFPFSINNVITAETSKTISLTAFVKGDGTSDPYSDGWNMVGLPYFSKFEGNGSNLPFFYLSDGGSSKTYTYFDPDDLTGTNALNPFISYYVQADNTLATSGATFDLSSRRLSPTIDNDLQEKDKVRIFYTSATGEDYMNLVLSDKEDSNYKIGSDLVKWFGTGTSKPQIYATQGGFDLAVDAVSYMQATNIPVTVYNQNAGSATFKANSIKAPNLSQLILTDKETGMNTDLLISDYIYNAAAGTVNNRFVITAVNKIVNSNNDVTGNESFTINLSDDNLILSHLKGSCNVRLFDIAGKLIFNGKPTVDVLNIHLPVKGVYTLSVSSETGVYSRKIISF